MVLQQRGLLVTEAFGNVLPLFLRQNDTIEALIHYMVVMERACILRQTVDFPAE